MVALFAFTFSAIHFPTTVRGWLLRAQGFHDQVIALQLPDTQVLWLDILFQAQQLVFLGYVIVTHLAMEVLRTIFTCFRNQGRPISSRPLSRPKSPFQHWM